MTDIAYIHGVAGWWWCEVDEDGNLGIDRSLLYFDTQEEAEDDAAIYLEDMME